MGVKETLAKMVAGKLTDEQKREMLQKFYEMHKDEENIETLIIMMKGTLNYQGDDAPKRQ